MRHTLVLLLLLLSISSFKELEPTKAKVYPTIEDYMSKRSAKVSVFVEKRTKRNVRSAGGNYYMIYSEINSKDLNKFVEKEALLLKANDTLFINCAKLGSTEYAPILLQNDKYMYFMAGGAGGDYNTSKGEQRVNSAAMGSLFGVLGSAVGASMDNPNGQQYHFILEKATGDITWLHRDKIRDVLAAKPELKREYLSRASPTDAASVLDLMRRFLLEE